MYPGETQRRSLATARQPLVVLLTLLIPLMVLALCSLAYAGYLNLEWEAPSTNVDGTQLTDLAKYRVYYGTGSGVCAGASYQEVASAIPNPVAGTLVSYSLTGLTTGTTYFVQVSAIDASGNESACSNEVNGPAASDGADTTAPTGSITINEGAAYTAWTAATLNLAATDAVGVTGYYVSTSATTPASGAAGWVAVTPATSYTGNADFTLSTGDGTKTIYAWYKDAAGNVSARSSDTIVLDQTAPSNGTLTATAGSGQVALSWSGFSDGGSGLATSNTYKLVFATSAVPSAQCASGTQIYQGTGTSYTHTGRTNGTTYYYRLCATDRAGNVSSGATANATPQASGDTTPPTVTITSPTSASTYSTSTSPLALAGTASDNVGVSQVTWSNDRGGSGTASGTTSWSVSGIALQSGTNLLTVTAADAAGNTATDTLTVTYSPPATAGLVAAYAFGEGAGTTTADASGNNLSGTVSGAIWTAQGKYGNALSFDGTDDMVSVADANALDLTTSLTVEAWVYPTSLGDWRTVVLKEADWDHTYALYASDGAGRPAGHIHTGSQDIQAVGPSPLPLNTWSHLALTYDGATLRLYVNGTAVASQATSAATMTSTGALRIGGNSLWGEYFAGRIDEVRIYNRALSQGEIQTDMATPIGGGTPGDATAPTGGITINANAAFTNSTSVTLNLSASDAVGVTGYYVSSASTTPSAGAAGWVAVTPTASYAADVAFSLPAGDGTKTVYAWYKDAAGNVSARYSDTIVLDTTAPTDGTLTAISGDKQVALSWTGFADAGSGLATANTYKLVFQTSSLPNPTCSNGTKIYEGTGTSYTHTGRTNGATYYYRVCARDALGNTSAGATVTAVANPPVPVSVTKKGKGKGLVTSTPAGISCGSTCSASFAYGSQVTLTATPEAGSVFKGWSGDCTGTGTCTVTATQARNVTATFSRAYLFTDDPLLQETTPVKTIHLTELRAAVNTARGDYGLGAATWTEPTLVPRQTEAKRVHLTELRTALSQVYAAAGLGTPSFTDPTVTPWETPIKAAHLSELRAYLRALP